jgi:hypothetical protein
MTTITDFTRAVTHLAARPHGETGWKYYDDASQVWYVATQRELEALGALLARGVPDAYSRWCSDVTGVPL